MAEQIKERIADILGDFSSLNSAKELFSELNYKIVRNELPRHGWGKMAREALADDPQIIATHQDFHIIYGRLASNRLLITPQRAVVNTLLREHPYALFVFSSEDEKLWHFVNVRVAAKEDLEENRNPQKRRLFRRITLGKTKRLRTAIDRISMLDLAAIQPELFGIPPLVVQSQHDKAFDVEAVTKEFYGAYEELFKREIREKLKNQTGDSRWAHDYALQLLNRIMFLYFVQRKGWLGEDDEFIETFWNAYKKSNQPKDTFFEKWLKVLFFEAFNNQKNLLNTHQRAYLPENIRKALWDAPYLNGGLFKKNKLDHFLDNNQKVIIIDQQFAQVFKLFQQYNFTIAEDSPLDQEVAVDPEMIGKVYESLVNLTETGMERSAAGIFYTPRTEIDLMCRLSLVDNLANHLGQGHKNLLYELVFSLDLEEKEQADKAVAKAGLWPDVEKRLNEITVVDPACGSGSFLVGMLYVLNDLLERAEKQRGQPSDRYKRKKQIIGQSLYGVDVMDWACHVAELRLWLALIVDSEFTKQELSIRKEPLLPHFSFKIRCGDSLVQEVGGIDMAHRRGVLEISPNIKQKLSEIRTEKNKFYSNDPTCRFKSPEALESYEVLVFRELLQDRANNLENEAKDLMRQQEGLKAHRQMTLTGEVEATPQQLLLRREELEQQIKAKMDDKRQVEIVLNGIRDKTSVPFVWDISFAEIFESESNGFDIVIGNPPYVRQENIAAPELPDGTVVTKDKKQYKVKLAHSVYKKYPTFFGYINKAGIERVEHKIDAKSDLYIYFYFHGLSLLNDKGSFCFITSNSWLDVGYGADLQEFLLKRCHVTLIIDNKAKRSFKEADVNTIIVLFSPTQDSKIKDDISLEKEARFVMFNVPFEEILHPAIFEEIEEAKQKKALAEYRVFPIEQADLLADGCEMPEEGEEEQAVKKKAKSPGLLIKTAKYIGNKWGGKYLRAPDIYWTILEKGKDKLIRLGDIAEVRRGFTTGCNEFFYLDDEKIKQWGIEPEFLKPVISSTHEIKSLVIKPEFCTKLLFCCPYTKEDLKKKGFKGAYEYVLWGAKQKTRQKGKHTKAGVLLPEAPTVACHRPEWHCIDVHRPGDFIVPRLIREKFFFADNPHGMSETDMFFHGYAHCFPRATSGVLNCTYVYLILEIVGRQGIEGRFNVYGPELAQLDVLNCTLLSVGDRSGIEKCLSKMGRRDMLKIRDEARQVDRKELDDIVFSVLGLTKGERDAVYEAVIDLVESRLKKAESLS
jgi:type I restriction-modification system DNA methylase subunit